MQCYITLIQDKCVLYLKFGVHAKSFSYFPFSYFLVVINPTFTIRLSIIKRQIIRGGENDMNFFGIILFQTMYYCEYAHEAGALNVGKHGMQWWQVRKIKRSVCFENT